MSPHADGIVERRAFGSPTTTACVEDGKAGHHESTAAVLHPKKRDPQLQTPKRACTHDEKASHVPVVLKILSKILFRQKRGICR